MKKGLLLAVAALSMSVGFAQTKKSATKATVKTVASVKPVTVKADVKTSATATTKNPVEFTEMTYSFGKIPQGVPATHTFTFKNTSGAPVIIENASAQCGCT